VFRVREVVAVEGLERREDPAGGWIPPTTRTAFQTRTDWAYYRWSSAGITPCTRNDRGEPWPSEDGSYSSATMFWVNNWVHFRAVPFDVTRRDSFEPFFVWPALTFHHYTVNIENIPLVLSVADIFGLERYLGAYAPNPSWMPQLLPGDYGFEHGGQDIESSPPSAGLGGRIPLIVALVAFSCPADMLGVVLCNDRSWWNDTWTRHNRGEGSKFHRMNFKCIVAN
jgi:hypothetical protein